MRPTKPLIWAALVVLLFQATGCRSFGPLERPLPATRQEALRLPRTVRVTKTDGETVELTTVWVDSVVVGGIETQSGRQRVWEIPLAAVLALDERHFSFAKTAILILSPFAVAVLAVVIGCSINECHAPY